MNKSIVSFHRFHHTFPTLCALRGIESSNRTADLCSVWRSPSSGRTGVGNGVLLSSSLLPACTPDPGSPHLFLQSSHWSVFCLPYVHPAARIGIEQCQCSPEPSSGTEDRKFGTASTNHTFLVTAEMDWLEQEFRRCSHQTGSPPIGLV